MKVLLLGSGGTAPPRRLSQLLGSEFEIRVLERQSDTAAHQAAAWCEVIVGGRIPRGLLYAAKELKAILIPYAGIPSYDRENLANFPNVLILNSHYNAQFVAEHAWALLLAAAKKILPGDAGLRAGDWSIRYSGELSAGLAGKTLLLVGYGAIGRHLAAYGRAFGMRVTAIKRRPGSAPELDALGTQSELHSFLREADAVICSLPGSFSSADRIAAAEFDAMKQGAIFVNVGRGSAVNEGAFHAALRTGRLGAAAIDSWWVYPENDAARTSTSPSRQTLAGFSNLIFSPHRASHVVGRDTVRIDALADILRALAAGKPINVVDRDEWY